MEFYSPNLAFGDQLAGASSSSLLLTFSTPVTPSTNFIRLHPTSSVFHGFRTYQRTFSGTNANSRWRALHNCVRCRAGEVTKGVEFKNEIEDENENEEHLKHPQRQELRRKKLAVFVSGGGSNFRALHQAALKNQIYGDVIVLITDKPGCGASGYARDSDIPIVVFPKSKSAPSGLSSMDLITTLRQFEVNFLLLAGYLKLLPIELVQAYPRSILNIHPSLLPAFGGKGYYGMKVHEAVIKSGARFSGPTIHFVDEKYDTGRILAQRVVPVLANDAAENLAARVLHEEHLLYVEVVAAICEDRIHWRKDGVPLIRKFGEQEEYY